jgi:hypothetical protein
LVESINKLVVTPDDASANVLTGDDDDETDEDIVVAPAIRGDEEPLFDDATPDVRPDDDG